MAGMAHAMPAHLYIDAQNPFIPNKPKKTALFLYRDKPKYIFFIYFCINKRIMNY